MPLEEDRHRLSSGAHLGVSEPGLLGKIVTMVAGVLLLAAAFMLSLLVFAVVAVVALGVLGYFWWKTRELRRQMREHPPGGRVIEGEVIVETVAEDETRRR